MNESSVFKVWHDSIDDVERADVSVLDDVINVWSVTYLLMKVF